jgi:ABC-type multidrug transport system fused ATPase/permease subunit
MKAFVKSNKGKKIVSHSLLSNYIYVYKTMWEYRKSLIGYGLAEVIFNVLTPLGYAIIPSIVVGLLVKKVSLSEFIGTLAIVFLIYGVIAGTNSYLVSRNRMQYIDIRCNKFWTTLCSKCLHMDYQLMEQEQVRKDLEKAMDCLRGNHLGLEGFMHRNVSLASNILGLITYACIISFVHPVILILLFIISLLQMLVFNCAKHYEYNKKEIMSTVSVTQNYLQEQAFDVKAGKDIRLYQLHTLINRVYDKANFDMKKIKARIKGVYYINDVVAIVLRFFREAVSYGYLIYLLINGLEVSYFVLYLGIISGFAIWFTKITEDMSEVGRFHLSISDFRDFIEKKNIFRHKEGKDVEGNEIALDILFDHVSFRYEGSEENVLNDVSFHMKKGEKLALVGINGAGKTTIVKLMCGFYQPTEGRILVNGIDIRDINIEKYFKQIAVVFQDAFTLSFTIGENITGLSSESLDREKAINAMEISGLLNKVESLEKGMDTFLNKDMEEGGIQLSGGEMQKLMLARALYKNAKLLILDEPTAALDAIAESELYERYQRLLKGRTSLFISHRLASTRFCDHIIFLEEGKITEEGNHDTLLELGRNYAHMFQVQSRYYKEEETYESQKSLA